ncbi:hypothetical protein E0L36_20840 [Streptomyces sp. AJS327]|nr:hypothetical protein [Streptomyces sp. AJS327]
MRPSCVYFIHPPKPVECAPGKGDPGVTARGSEPPARRRGRATPADGGPGLRTGESRRPDARPGGGVAWRGWGGDSRGGGVGKTPGGGWGKPAGAMSPQGGRVWR